MTSSEPAELGRGKRGGRPDVNHELFRVAASKLYRANTVAPPQACWQSTFLKSLGEETRMSEMHDLNDMYPFAKVIEHGGFPRTRCCNVEAQSTHLRTLLLHPFRYFDPVRKRWIRARYVAERHVIEASYEKWEITG